MINEQKAESITTVYTICLFQNLVSRAAIDTMWLLVRIRRQYKPHRGATYYLSQTDVKYVSQDLEPLLSNVVIWKALPKLALQRGLIGLTKGNDCASINPYFFSI